VASVALCSLLALAGCTGGQVAALADDPIAAATPAGGELVTSQEEAAHDGGLLGKPSPAQVTRTYAFDSEAAARRATGELLTEAESAGWEVTSVAPDGTGFSAERLLDGRRAALVVALNLAPTIQPAPGVFVSLSQRGD
jgi:hypothetical protein